MAKKRKKSGKHYKILSMQGGILPGIYKSRYAADKRKRELGLKGGAKVIPA
jgi:hypothetical protein